MKNPFTDTLSHTGNSMLSGMTAKAPAVTEAEIQAFLDSGGEIKQIKSRKTRKHTTRTKSHMKGGGRWGAYNVGGNHRIAAARRSA